MSAPIATSRLSLFIASMIAAGALVLSGCTADTSPAGDDTGGSSEQDDVTNGSDASDDGGGASSGGLGTATLDGVTYEFTEVILCEPFDDGTVRFDLEVIALGLAANGARVQLDAYQTVAANVASSDFDWAGPEGIFGSSDNATVTVEGDRVLGSGAMLDAETDSVSLSMTFDVALPSEFTECR